MLKKILIVLLIALVVIQFFHPAKNQSAGAQANAISKAYPVPQEVTNILKISCNDCHSNNTVYPWYNNIQPVAWWLNSHVNEGKGKLNFDEFLSYQPDKARKKLNGVIKEIKGGGMPLGSYLWIHKNAILSDPQKQLVTQWAQRTMNNITAKNNLPPFVDEKR